MADALLSPLLAVEGKPVSCSSRLVKHAKVTLQIVLSLLALLALDIMHGDFDPIMSLGGVVQGSWVPFHQSLNQNHSEDFGISLSVKAPPWPNIHYQFGPNGTAMYVPCPMCFLPPPQPFYFEAYQQTTKAAVVTMALWTSLSKVASIKDVIILYAFGTYQMVTLVMSLILIVKKVLFTMPFNTGWDRFECFGLAVTNAPWAFNFWLLFIKCCLIIPDGTKCQSVFDDTPPPSSLLPPPTSLLPPPSWQKKKFHVNCSVWLVTAIGVALSITPFAIINIVPGLFVFPFLPAEALLVGHLLNRLLKQNFNEHSWREILNAVHQAAVMKTMTQANKERILNYTVILSVPFLVIFTILLQSTAAQTVYLYGGSLSWWECFGITWQERQIAIYANNFKTQVLMKLARLMELLSESA